MRARAVAAVVSGLLLAVVASPAGAQPGVAHQSAAPHPASTASSVTVAAAKLPRVYACGSALLRPSTFPLWCLRSTIRAERMRWTSWTAARATAVGRYAFRTGQIVDGRHVWASYPARFVLDRPRVAKGGMVWTRLTRTYTGAVPQYDKRTKTIWLSYRVSGGKCSLTWTEDRSEPLCGRF